MGLNFGAGSGDEREKSLKRMGKAELVALALRRETEIDDLQGQMEGLRAEIERLKAEMEDKDAEVAAARESRTIELQEAGSIAEASLRISGVFAEAQKAADTYLENIRQLEARTKNECVRREQAAEALAKKLVADARQESEQILNDAELAGAKREREAEQYYDSVKERTRSALTNLSRFHEDYVNLKRIADGSASEKVIEAKATVQPDEKDDVSVRQEPKQDNNQIAIEGDIAPEALYRKLDRVYEEKDAES